VPFLKTENDRSGSPDSSGIRDFGRRRGAPGRPLHRPARGRCIALKEKERFRFLFHALGSPRCPLTAGKKKKTWLAPTCDDTEMDMRRPLCAAFQRCASTHSLQPKIANVGSNSLKHLTPELPYALLGRPGYISCIAIPASWSRYVGVSRSGDVKGRYDEGCAAWKFRQVGGAPFVVAEKPGMPASGEISSGSRPLAQI